MLSPYSPNKLLHRRPKSGSSPAAFSGEHNRLSPRFGSQYDGLLFAGGDHRVPKSVYSVTDWCYSLPRIWSQNQSEDQLQEHRLKVKNSCCLFKKGCIFSTSFSLDACFVWNVKMFSFRRLLYQASPCSTSALLQLLIACRYKTTSIAGYQTLAPLSNRSIAPITSPSCRSIEQQMVIGGKVHPSKILFSTVSEPILVRACDTSRVASELVNAVEERRFEDAWKAYEKHMRMDGFPRKSVLSMLITGFAESSNVELLNKACGLVDLIFDEEKHHLLEKEPLIYLSFILARCGLPVPASNVLRKLVQMNEFPPVEAWSGVIGHMSQTTNGAFLAAEMIMEIGYPFKDNRVDPRKKSNRPLLSMKPNSFVFNIALTGCLLFGTTRKAEQLLDLMPRVGVKADGNLLIVMACIYEKNGHIDEIKKLKRHIDEVCLGDLQFQQFYDCMLSCHLKFGDLNSAADMILEMLTKAKEANRSLAAAKSVLDAVGTGKASRPFQTAEHKALDFLDKFVLIKSQPPSYIEFLRDKSFSRLEAEAKESLRLLSDKLQAHVELVRSVNGIVFPTEKIYAKLVKAFLEADKVSDLATFLIKVSKEEAPVSIENSVVVQVINACISLDLLDQAHDLLDEMRFSGIKVGSSVYSSLLKAYCKVDRQVEITALLKDARKAGIQFDSSCYETLIQSRVHQNDVDGALHMFKEMKHTNIRRSAGRESEMVLEGCPGVGEAGFTAKLIEEIRDNQKVNCGVHDWNNVIHFFCKKRLMNDAQKALSKMRALGFSPNAQTFHSFITAYAAIGGKYVEVTDLWVEMKVLASSSSMKFDQELLDSLVYCFVRGGFFVRAMEVIKMMEKGTMFIDKYKYRSLWLKYHRKLYKGKPAKIQTEAQVEKRDAALAFKRWIGLT